MKPLNPSAYLAIFPLLLAGCVTASGPIGQLPDLELDQQVGEIFVIRNSNFVGAANSFYITLDSQDIFAIRVGQYTVFKVASGEHYIGVKCFGGWTPTWKEDSTKFELPPAGQEYFIVSPDLSCADIKKIGAAEGRGWIAESDFLEMSQ